MSKGLIYFKDKGYVNFGSILSSEDVSKLAVLCRQIYETMDKDDPSYHTGGGVEGFNQLIIHDPNTATLINRIFCNSNIKSFLEEVLGRKYKILDIGFRRSKPGDRGLYMHQDGVGQVNMAICLDDNPDGDGATAFLSGSHLLEKSAKTLRLELPPILLNTFRFLFTPLICKKGDVCFFSNRVWHGRFRNKSKFNHDVLMLGLFPSGYRYSDQSWPDSLIKLDSAPELGRLLGSCEDLKASVRASCSEDRELNNIYCDTEHGYSIQIEDVNYLSNVYKPLKLILSLNIIKLIMKITRLLFTPIKFFKSVKKHK